jgi:hypothetical protein
LSSKAALPLRATDSGILLALGQLVEPVRGLIGPLIKAIYYQPFKKKARACVLTC